LSPDAEQDESARQSCRARPDFLDQAVGAELKLAGHRRDFLPNAAASTDEQRQD